MSVPSFLCNTISEWAMQNIHTFKSNGFGRQFLSMASPRTPEIKELKSIVMSIFNVSETALQEPVYKDFCGINLEGAAVHSHMDKNLGDLKHTRFNVLLSKPISGGHPVVGGKTLDIEEGGMWRCDAGSKTHASTVVIGKRPRIVMSFGFLLSEIEILGLKSIETTT